MYEIESVSEKAISRTEKSVMSETMTKRFFEFIDVSTLTRKSYVSGIKQFITFLAEKRVINPQRENVIEFKTELIAKGRKPATVSLYLSAVRRFFDWTESEKIYPNIARSVKSPKQDRSYHKRDYLTGSQIQAMLSKTGSKRDYAMIALIATTGLRTIEVVRANVSDIHNTGGIWLLDVQGKGHTDKDAYVKLSEPVLKAIQEYLQTRGEVKSNEPLFVSESRRNKGGRLTTRTVSGICKQAMREAGYDTPRLTAHSLRHSAATLALLSGMELSDVSQFLRHTSISVTMIYNHSVSRLKSQCENAVTSAIFGVKQVA